MPTAHTRTHTQPINSAAAWSSQIPWNVNPGLSVLSLATSGGHSLFGGQALRVQVVAVLDHRLHSADHLVDLRTSYSKHLDSHACSDIRRRQRRTATQRHNDTTTQRQQVYDGQRHLTSRVAAMAPPIASVRTRPGAWLRESPTAGLRDDGTDKSYCQQRTQADAPLSAQASGCPCAEPRWRANSSCSS